MSKQRMVNTKFWNDSYIAELDPIEKLLFLYFLTNEHTNISGTYELPLKIIGIETGIDKEMLVKIINRFVGKIYYLNGWVYIKNFQKHQFARGNSHIIKGIENEMKNIPDEIKEKIANLSQKDIPLIPPSVYLDSDSDININLNNTATNVAGEINNLIQEFLPINPTAQRFYANKTQRSALDRLLKQFGYESVLKLIRLLQKTNSKQFAPVITTPLELERDMGKLKAFVSKQHKSGIISA